MRNMSNSGKTAAGAVLAALALLALTGITLHETVFMWFLAACAAAYVACVAELLVRRRHRTLIASGAGTILFIAFGIAFLRQWGLAFNPDPDAMTARVDSEHPDLYFYLAAVSGAATLLLLCAGTVLPGRATAQRTRGAVRRRPEARPAPRRPASGPASRTSASRTSASRTPVLRAPKPPPARPAPAAKRAVQPARAKTSAAKPVTRKPVTPPAKSPARPPAPGTRRY